MTTTAQLESPGTIVAACATGIASIMVFALMPILVGTLAEQYQLDDLEAGLAASAYFTVYAALALSSLFWIRRWNWRHVTTAGYLAMLTGLALSAGSTSFHTAVAGLAVAGLGAGLIYPISMTLVSDMMHTDRIYAIKLMAEQAAPAGVLIIVSAGVLGLLDFADNAWLIAAVIAACVMSSLALPPSGTHNVSTAVTATHSSAAIGPALGLIGLGISFMGFAGLWVFIERIAAENAFPTEFTTLWLAVGLVTSAIGPALSAVLADRIGRLAPLYGGTGLAVASLALLTGEVDRSDFAITLIAMPLAYFFALSYVFSVIADADHNGRMAGLMPFALAIGSAAGPALIGLLRDSGGSAVAGTAIALLVGAGLVIWVASDHANRQT